MERRIGERHSVPWIDLTWLAKARWWRKQLVEEPVETLDVSTTGIGLLAKTVPTLRIGQVVELRTERNQARGQVRRIVPSDDASTSLYGLEFVESAPEFVEELFAHAGAPTDPRLEVYWRHAN
jgi:hypothetical protein